jgi:CXXC-20-CXXC protein
MKPRTCPNCGYKYSFLEYYQDFLLKFIGSKWNCKKCGSLLTFSVGRRTLVAIIAMIPIGFNSTLISFFRTSLNLPNGISILLFSIIFIFWAFLIYGFDSFDLIKKKE